MFQKHDISRDACQLYGGQAKNGYDWWWHSFTGKSRKTGKERSFFIEYFLCNPACAEDRPVLGQLSENKSAGKRPSYLMVKAGTWGEDACQLHRFFSWKEITVDKAAPYRIKAADCLACETALCGSVSVSKEQAAAHPELMCDSGSMSWSLKVSKQIAFNVGYGADSLFRRLQLFEMFWHAEGMKTAYSGMVTFNGEEYAISPESCYGYADKNWGKNFTTPWLWLSSNDLVSELTGKRLCDSVFDIGGGKPKIGFISLKGKLLSAFYYEGECREFNFSKFWTFTRTKFRCKETDDEVRWLVEQKTLRDRVLVKAACKKKDMLLMNYESPDGRMRHTRLWNGGNGKGVIYLYRDGRLVDKIRAAHIGCEYGEYDADKPYGTQR